MTIARFKKFKDGLFYFEFESGEDMVFEQVHPKILTRYNLKDDKSFVDQEFRLSFSEIFIDDDEDEVIYRIENLKALDQPES